MGSRCTASLLSTSLVQGTVPGLKIESNESGIVNRFEVDTLDGKPHVRVLGANDALDRTHRHGVSCLETAVGASRLA